MNDEEMKVNLQQMLKESYRSYPPGRLITFPEVQVGDTIRAEKSTGVVRVLRGKVISVAADFLASGLLRLSNTGESADPVTDRTIYGSDGWSLTLIDRPKPERPVGSVWYNPVNYTGYVRTDSQRPAYVGFSGSVLRHAVDFDSPIVKSFIPWADRPDAGSDGRVTPRCDCQDDPS